MDENNITKIWEELTEDYYSLAHIYFIEIHKLLGEFEDDQMQFSLELEAFEKECIHS